MDKSTKFEFQDTKPPLLSEEQMAESLKRRDMGYRLFQTYPLSSPMVGGLVLTILGIAAYSFIWGDHAELVLATIFLLGLAIAALVVPIEWLLMMNVVAFILADTYFDLRGLNYQYTRFVPLGMFAIRALLPSTLRRVRTYMLPGFFLKPFGLFFLMALLSATYDKFDPGATLLRALTMGFMLVAFGVGLPAYLTDDRRLRRGLHSILGVLALSIVVGWMAIPIESRSLFHVGDYSRVRGIYLHPNTLGLMAMLTFFPVFGWRLETPKGKRWPFTITLFALLMAILASGSRASIVGLVTGAIDFLRFRPLNTRSKVFLILLCVFAFTMLFGLPQFSPGMLRTDTGWRFELWQRALHLGQESPLLGSGFGSTNRVFSDDRPLLTRQGIYAGGSHNEYARIFVGVGAVGLFLALLGFGWVLFKAVRVIRAEKNPVIPVSLLAAVVSGLTNAIFEDWIFAFGGAPAFPFWFFLAFLAIYGHRRTLLWKNSLRHYFMRRNYSSKIDLQAAKKDKSLLNKPNPLPH
jgi:O-antigen ligase